MILEMAHWRHLFLQNFLVIVRYLCYYIQVPYYYKEDTIWS